MIALLLALAPVTYGHTVYGTLSPPFSNCTGTDANLFARECPSQHCEHVDCRDELERARVVWSAHCYGVIQCTDDVTAYCKWHSDGTVEAKNATCSDHRGERQ